MGVKTLGNAERGRGHLGRENIVETALGLLNEIGLDALSLRRLADELHVQAPALYWHFRNKQELLNAMAEAMLLSANPPTPETVMDMDWQAWLLLMGNGLCRTLLSYRDGARLLTTADVSRTGVASLDVSLGVLVKAGFSYREAMIGVMTVVNYTVGFVLSEQSTFSQPNEIEYFQQVVMTSDLPNLKAAFEQNIAPFPPEVEFEAALRLILDGMSTRR